MRRKTYFTSALLGCLLGAALSYCPYRVESSRLMRSYGPVIEELVAFRKKHTDDQGFWYNAYEGEAGNTRSRNVLSLIRSGEELAFQLWLCKYLFGYCMTGSLALPLIVFVAQNGVRHLHILFAFIATTSPAYADFSELEQKQFDRLRQIYKDNEISSAFEKAQQNQSVFLRTLASGFFATDHSAPWFGNFRTAIKLAQEGNWEDAQKKLNTSVASPPANGHLGPPQGLPKEHADLLIFASIANRLTGHSEEALKDLETLYRLHSAQPSSWNRNSCIFKQQQEVPEPNRKSVPET